MKSNNELLEIMKKFNKIMDEASYNSMPWSPHKSYLFKKPEYKEIDGLLEIPESKRAQKYSEFYELFKYLELLLNLSGGKLLDLGTGCGSISFLSKQLGWNVTASDYSDDLFNIKDIKFEKADYNFTFPFKDNEFDCITSKQVIEHLENPQHFIREVFRILNKKGTFIFSTPNIVSIHSRLVFYRTGFLKFFEESGWSEHCSMLHYSQLAFFLEKTGFNNIEVYTNRQTYSSFSRQANGAKMRYIAPFTGIFTKDKFPLPVRNGELLILKCNKY